MTIDQLYQLYLNHPSIQTDTRKLKQGDLFFALSGPNFDGNDFAEKALESGAAYAIVDREVPSKERGIIKVNNVLTTLQALAKHHREQFNIPFIAITGSNGKTTTKELVSTVLASCFKTYTTQGNLNNHIGIPLTLLRVKADAEMAVIEMGANHLKEIESYCEYTKPTHGIITNCGKAHLEGFGGIEGVKKGKGELFDYLRANQGTAFIFNMPYLQEMSAGIEHVVSYGVENADVIGRATPSQDYLQVEISDKSRMIIKTQLVGDYNLPNVLCAVAVGRYFDIADDKIKMAIESYVPGNSRSQMLIKGTNHIILDAYNANPTSMKVAIENIAAMNVPLKVLMLGGMMELGEESLQEHLNIVELIKKYSWHKVILVGGDFEKVDHSFLYFNDATSAADWSKQQNFQDIYFLIKGSRSIKMEEIAAVL